MSRLNPIKKLAGQTATYGLSSIIGRFLNYLLVPLHTSRGVFSPDQYGIITELYSYVAFLVIILTYGMETAYFRFSSNKGHKEQDVFKTTLISLLVTSSLFIGYAMIFSQEVADWLRYPNNKEFVVWFAFIVGLDAISSVPLARLRAKGKAMKFALINFGNVAVNFGLNLFFLAYCLPKYQAGETNFLIESFYNPELGVSYVFIANLIASVIKLGLLLPVSLKDLGRFSPPILKQMLKYGAPLLLAGAAGIINETLDRILLKRMLFDTKGEQATMTIIGIYGACYKISIIIALFIQAFRYAAEPFFFSQEKKRDSREVHANIMNYFVATVCFIFLGVMLFLDIIKYFIPNNAYWVGLRVVPILLMANICLGIYYVQSVWFKLTGKTIYGAYINVFGATITIICNILWIPKYGYMGSAWATLACYLMMVITSYVLGQRFYRIPYNLIRVFGYVGVALGIYVLYAQMDLNQSLGEHLVRLILMGIFAGLVIFIERKSKSDKNMILE